jgi:RNA polymerase sigma-70 factor (ECF subfamily)
MAMTETTPATEAARLVRAAQSGETDAFAELVRAEQSSLLMAARGILGDYHEAEDAALDALVAAWRDLPKLRDPRRFRAWLSRILTRIALRRRRRLPRGGSFVDPDRLPAPDPPREDPRLSPLLAELTRLPAKYRVLLTLRYLRDHTPGELSEITGLSPARVKSRLHRARELLRWRFDDERTR